jgi:hypothetical protein
VSTTIFFSRLQAFTCLYPRRTSLPLLLPRPRSSPHPNRLHSLPPQLYSRRHLRNQSYPPWPRNRYSKYSYRLSPEVRVESSNITLANVYHRGPPFRYTVPPFLYFANSFKSFTKPTRSCSPPVMNYEPEYFAPSYSPTVSPDILLDGTMNGSYPPPWTTSTVYQPDSFGYEHDPALCSFVPADGAVANPMLELTNSSSPPIVDQQPGSLRHGYDHTPSSSIPFFGAIDIKDDAQRSPLGHRGALCQEPEEGLVGHPALEVPWTGNELELYPYQQTIPGPSSYDHNLGYSATIYPNEPRRQRTIASKSFTVPLEIGATQSPASPLPTRSATEPPTSSEPALFVCANCKEVFTNHSGRQNLWRHKTYGTAKCGNKEKRFKCWCGRTFTRNDHLRKHRNKAHELR